MANTRFSYVRQYELPDILLPGTYMVVRLDGKGFHRFADTYGFIKPNDRSALELMNAAAQRTMECETLRSSILMAFGESDEYSFLFSKSSDLFKRRGSKILSTVLSMFTASYTMLWPTYFPRTPLRPDAEGPSFDGRVILYPSAIEVIDYFKWRQADAHINNLYNTAFWTLIQQGGLTATQAHAKLNGTVSSQKHEILFSQYGVNYNSLDAMFRRGSLLIWTAISDHTTHAPVASIQHESRDQISEATYGHIDAAGTASPKLVLLHEDMLKDAWWDQRRPALFGVP